MILVQDCLASSMSKLEYNMNTWATMGAMTLLVHALTSDAFRMLFSWDHVHLNPVAVTDLSGHS